MRKISAQQCEATEVLRSKVGVHKLHTTSASSRQALGTHGQKHTKNIQKIDPQTFQNRARRPPKLSLEPSKTLFLKTSNLRRQKRSCGKTLGWHFRPTWLHLGLPRCSKIKAETSKNRCSKTIRFQHRFFKGSDVVLEGFFVGYGIRKRMKNVKTRC